MDHINNDEKIKQLLRLHDEPCLHIDEMQAHNIVMQGCNEFMDRLESFYSAWGKQELTIDLPVKQVFSHQDVQGDFRLMPCTVVDKKLKFVKVIGTNEEERTIADKICVGKSLLIDYYDNYIYATIDVCALSSFRTAAVSVLAMRYCQPKAQNIGLIGMGRIGFYSAYILYQWLGLRSFLVTDPCHDTRKRFESLCQHYMPEAKIELLPLAGVLDQSDVLFLTTTSAKAVLHAENAAAINFISSVGADADNLSEIDASLLESHRLVTDSMQSMCLGDMKVWATEGKLNQEDVTILPALAETVSTCDEPTLFISTGIAANDLIINQFVYEKSQAATLTALKTGTPPCR
ncbi:MAG: hypothetical protein OET90_10775 [Desulfuromonadales bacterium]|nr:hypothetical protein [Desulfuromonadales bacterium]